MTCFLQRLKVPLTTQDLSGGHRRKAYVRKITFFSNYHNERNIGANKDFSFNQEIINSQPAKRTETERARERERQTQRTRKERDNGEIKKEIKAQRFFTGKLVSNSMQANFTPISTGFILKFIFFGRFCYSWPLLSLIVATVQI